MTMFPGNLPAWLARFTASRAKLLLFVWLPISLVAAGVSVVLLIYFVPGGGLLGLAVASPFVFLAWLAVSSGWRCLSDFGNAHLRLRYRDWLGGLFGSGINGLILSGCLNRTWEGFQDGTVSLPQFWLILLPLMYASGVALLFAGIVLCRYSRCPVVPP